jgi:hypothetical protein
MAEAKFALSRQIDHSLPLSELPLLQKKASINNNKLKIEEEAEPSMARKCLRHTDDDGSDDDTSDSPEEESSEEEETEEEVSSEETSMNQLDTSEGKLYIRCARGYLFGDDGDTPSTSPDTPPTPKSN